MCVKCLVNRELSSGRKGFLRYMIRIPLLHIMVIYFYTSYVERNYCKGGIFFMQKFFGIFVDSAKEFKNLKSVIMAALLVALHTVFAMFLSIQVTDSLRISVSFIANVAAVFLDLLWVLSAVELVI